MYKRQLVINKGKHQKATLTTAIEVKDKQAATANLIDPQLPLPKMKSVTLPEVDRRDIKTVLDLGSGEFIENFGRNGDFGKFNQLGKGDLWQDGPSVIGTLRGGELKFADARKPFR